MEEADTTPDPQLQKSKKKKKKINNKLTVTIETQSEQPGRLAPLVGYFPSGFDPVNPQTPQPDVKVYRNHKRTKRLELVVSPKGSNVDFVGTNYSGEAASGRMCNYALGILDKNTHKLKFVPIAANKIFRLDPRVRSAGTSEKEPIKETNEEQTVWEKINTLNDLYGSAAQIKRAKKAALMRQTDNASSEQELKNLVEETVTEKEALANTAAEASRNIPPHDLSATTPEKAYPLESIIFKGEWDFLKDILELVQAGKEITPDRYPSFVCNRVFKLDLIKDEAEKARIAGILSYISHLINFKDRHSLDGQSSSKHHKVPTMLLQKFRKMFADTEKMRLADEKIGLLISYVLVLTLHVDEFQTDFIDIARDLKMSALSVRPYFDSLGCKFKVKNRVSMATLNVPLQFPEVRRKRRRRT